MNKNLLYISLILNLLSIKNINAQAGYINTIVGNGVRGFSGDGGPATLSEISAPQGVVVDSAGNIYITDSYNYRIRKVNTLGIILTIAGTGSVGYNGDNIPTTTATLNWPLCPVLDSSGNIYFSDAFNARIRKITVSTGVITTIAGNGVGGYSGDGGLAISAEIASAQNGIAIDAGGNIYIADCNSYRVRKVNSSGFINTFAGNGIQGYSGDGGPATAAEFGNGGNGLRGITVDNYGNLFVTDNGNNNVRMVNTSNIVSTIAGNRAVGYSGDEGLATSAELYDPVSVAIDNIGNIYISDLSNNRIREVSTTGIISTIAGISLASYSGDGGPATSSELNAPFGVTVDSHDNIYISDQQNNRIRKINSSTDVTGNKALTGSSSISIYPNPTSDKVYIRMIEITQNSLCTLYNITGQKVWSGYLLNNTRQFEINIENFPPGLYILKVEGHNGLMIVKKLEIVR